MDKSRIKAEAEKLRMIKHFYFTKFKNNTKVNVNLSIPYSDEKHIIYTSDTLVK